MNKLNVYHRGFKDYRKNTLNNTSCYNDRKAIKKSNVELDVLNNARYVCHINTDWIDAIEEGLPFIDKAIQEERQFIRTDGEILPIEKIRKVSRSSVEHLARHSDMITHVPENENDVIPDKLLMVEKYSDYAIYENRFLYMLLSYLNEFIYYRLSKIEELRGTYNGNMSFKKICISKNREFEVSLNLKDKVTNNPYKIIDEETDALIQRIKDCQQIVNSYLNRNLIVEVSKAPMIKAPITKTNVLKMNNNFKHALALYDFISTYKGLGYSYEEVKEDLTPLNDDIADELSELTNLSLYLSFKYNNHLQDRLETEYQAEEDLKKKEEEKELLERIDRLKRRASEDNKTLGEYLVLLEQRNAQLESDSEELERTKQTIIELNLKIDDLKKERIKLRQQVEDLKQQVLEKLQQINSINQKYIDDINNMISKNKEDYAGMQNEHHEELERLREASDKALLIKEDYITLKMQDLERQYEEKLEQAKLDDLETYKDVQTQLDSMNDIIRTHEEERDALVKEYEDKINEIEAKSRDLIQEKTNEANKIVEFTRQENIKLKEDNDFLSAQIRSVKIKAGEVSPSQEFTSKEQFEQIEEEYEAFKNFYEKQWILTKKQIKKELLSTRNIKETARKDKSEKKKKSFFGKKDK